MVRSDSNAISVYYVTVMLQCPNYGKSPSMGGTIVRLRLVQGATSERKWLQILPGVMLHERCPEAYL